MTMGNDASSRSFRNLVLSYRGSERQAPNVLQLALKFSRLMELAEQEGRHLPSMSTEDRLRAIISDFHDCPGLATKNQLDEDKIRAILNILVGTCPVSWIKRYQKSTCYWECSYKPSKTCFQIVAVSPVRFQKKQNNITMFPFDFTPRKLEMSWEATWIGISGRRRQSTRNNFAQHGGWLARLPELHNARQNCERRLQWQLIPKCYTSSWWSILLQKLEGACVLQLAGACVLPLMHLRHMLILPVSIQQQCWRHANFQHGTRKRRTQSWSHTSKSDFDWMNFKFSTDHW